MERDAGLLDASGFIFRKRDRGVRFERTLVR
jgi:hypothetical protein